MAGDVVLEEHVDHGREKRKEKGRIFSRSIIFPGQSLFSKLSDV